MPVTHVVGVLGHHAAVVQCRLILATVLLVLPLSLLLLPPHLGLDPDLKAGEAGLHKMH